MKKLLSLICLLVSFVFIDTTNCTNNKWTFIYYGFIQTNVTISDTHIAFLTCKDKISSPYPEYDTTKKTLYCVDKNTGRQKWVKGYSEQEVVWNVVSNDQYLCTEVYKTIKNSDQGKTYETKISCYTIEDAKEIWSKTIISKPENGDYAKLPSSLLIDNDKLYYYNLDAYCIELSSGKQIWSSEIEADFASPLLMSDDKIIFINATQNFVCINNKGVMIWKTDNSQYKPEGTCHEYERSCFVNRKYGKIFGIDAPLYYANDRLITFLKKVKNSKIDLGTYIGSIDINTGAYSSVSKLDVRINPYDFYLSNNKIYSGEKIVTCHKLTGELVWKTPPEKKFFTIGVFTNYTISVENTNLKANYIQLHRLSDGKEFLSITPEIKSIENAILEGSDLFLFGEGKLQKIDLSQIDFSTKLKFNPTQGTYTQNGTSYELDTPLEITNNRVFISASNIFEPLCGKNEFENKEGIIKATLDDKTIELQINNHVAKINGTEKQIDPNNPKIMPYINKEGYMMVPIRFIAESFGCKIIFDPDTKEIIVTYQP